MRKANATLTTRVNSDDKAEATAILNAAGTNLSTAVNMLLKQIIIQKGLPFNVTLKQEAIPKAVQHTIATMALEGISLSEKQIQRLLAVEAGEMTTEEAVKEVIREVENG
ncbi:MAG TPA: type II toxin-antitoxin system RelB/DinJ family antitoxin [Mogibacterium sp.]|nr:type II toxin-antitoxin system RelB/DinJ family antitoxin [Mogibacterium sp.]